MSARPTTARTRNATGFTLLELTVVLGILALLGGLGIGMLRQGDSPRMAARAIVGAELRRAVNSARSRGLPTEVLFARGADGRPDTIRSRVLVPVGTWHFEPDEVFLFEDLRPALQAVAEASGRFGHCLRPNPEGRGAMFSLPLDGTSRLFSLVDGFSLRLDLFLEAPGEMEIARIGSSFAVSLTRDLRVKVRLVQAGAGDSSGVAVFFEGSKPLPLYRWCTLEVLHDGSELSCRIDELEVGRVPAKAPLFQRADDVLELSPLAAPVLGKIDEVQLLAYELGEPQSLPVEVRWQQELIVRLDRYGDPVGATSFAWRLLEVNETETVRIGAGGVLQ